jgi:hypothetical protein
MKNLNSTSVVALFAGGSIAILPLHSFTELLLGVAIAFVALNAANYLIKGVK